MLTKLFLALFPKKNKNIPQKNCTSQNNSLPLQPKITMYNPLYYYKVILKILVNPIDKTRHTDWAPIAHNNATTAIGQTNEVYS